MSKQLVIVIAGVTCGGKTTVSNNLKSKFNDISVLHQDSFYFPKDLLDEIPELNYQNWDKINSYDMDKMIEAINAQTSKIVVLEGILLLEDLRILNLADLIFFILLDKDQCFERRVARNYLPPDPPGYFEKYAWPEYDKHLAMIKNVKRDIIFLNGTDSIKSNMDIVLGHINKKLSNHK